MALLSPAAQAVLTAVIDADTEYNGDYPYSHMLVAGLRTLALQVVEETPYMSEGRAAAVRFILEIVKELEV